MTTNRSPLLTTLYIARDCLSNTTTETLCERYGLSQRQLMRHIDEARQLGAQIRTARANGRHYWVCDNWMDIEQSGRLARWLTLEEQRCLV